MSVTIYHNPRCSKSRQTLALITESGSEHTIVTYLENPPDAETIMQLASKLDVPVEQLLRHSESVVKEAQDLPDSDHDAELANWIAAHPAALQRPIVVDDVSGDAVIGRPPENVLRLLTP